MSHPIELQDLYKVATAIRELHKKARHLHRTLAELEFQADALLQEFSELAKLVCSKFENNLSPPPNSPNDPISPDGSFLQQLAANGGVEEVDIRWLANGKAQVSINGGSPFPLSASLAHLLEILCADSGTSHDHLVAWKSRDRVEIELAARMEKTSTRQTVHSQLNRLRNKLTSNGENRFLILTQRDKGIRFALLRKTPVMKGELS